MGLDMPFIRQPRLAYDTAQMVPVVVKSAALLSLLLFAVWTHFSQGDAKPWLG